MRGDMEMQCGTASPCPRALRLIHSETLSKLKHPIYLNQYLNLQFLMCRGDSPPPPPSPSGVVVAGNTP